MDVSTGHRLWGLIIRHPAVGCEHQVNTSTAVFNSFQYLNLVYICLYIMWPSSAKSSLICHSQTHQHTFMYKHLWTKVHMQAVGIRILAGMHLGSEACPEVYICV